MREHCSAAAPSSQLTQVPHGVATNATSPARMLAHQELNGAAELGGSCRLRAPDSAQLQHNVAAEPSSQRHPFDAVDPGVRLAQLIACSSDLESTLDFMGRLKVDAEEFRPRSSASCGGYTPTELLLWPQQQQHLFLRRPTPTNAGSCWGWGRQSNGDGYGAQSIGGVGYQAAAGDDFDLEAADFFRRRRLSSSSATPAAATIWGQSTAAVEAGWEVAAEIHLMPQSSGRALLSTATSQLGSRHDGGGRGDTAARRFRRFNSLPSLFQSDNEDAPGAAGVEQGGGEGVVGPAASGVCTFCMNKGEPEEVYTSHQVKCWRTGEILCLALRRNQCPACLNHGHTPGYCPRLQARAAAGILTPQSLSGRSPAPFRGEGSRQRRNSAAGDVSSYNSPAQRLSYVGGNNDYFYRPGSQQKQAVNLFSSRQQGLDRVPQISSHNIVSWLPQIPGPMPGHQINEERNSRQGREEPGSYQQPSRRRRITATRSSNDLAL